MSRWWRSMLIGCALEGKVFWVFVQVCMYFRHFFAKWAENLCSLLEVNFWASNRKHVNFPNHRTIIAAAISLQLARATLLLPSSNPSIFKEAAMLPLSHPYHFRYSTQSKNPLTHFELISLIKWKMNHKFNALKTTTSTTGKCIYDGMIEASRE